MAKRPRTISRAAYLRSKEKMLSDFGIDITENISAELSSRYPNEVAVEKYTRKLIMERLGDD